MSQGQAADHEQAHAAGDRDVHGGRRGEPLVDRREVLGGEADAGVVDLDQDPAVGQRVTGDPDLGLRGGERGGVLKQLGEEVHEVVDDPAGDLGRRDRGQFDALVLLHLGGGGAEHVDQRDRAGPPAARLLAGEDEEVLAVPAHTGREVVELEQRGELVRVGLAGLQLGDERELALDEALGAAREVGEHRVDVAPEEGLLGGEADGLAVHVVEGRGHLADLVPGVHADGLDGGVDVLRVGLGELLDQLGQAFLGDLGRGVLEAAQGADHGPRHDEGADEGDAEDEQDQRTVDDGLALRILPQLTGHGLHVAEQDALDAVHGVDLGVVLVGEVQVTAGGGPHRVLRRQHALGVLVGGGDRRVAPVQGRGQVVGVAAGRLVDRLEGLELVVLTVERGLAVQPVALDDRAAGPVARGQRRRDDRLLDGGVLLGGRERGERAGPLDHLGVAGRLRHVLGQAQERADETAVRLDRHRVGDVLLVRAAPDRVELGDLRGDLADVLADAAQRLVALDRGDLLGGGEEGLELQVRLPARVGDLVVADRAAVGQRAGGVAALGLEGLGEVRRLTGQLGEQLHVVELLHVLERLVDADATQGGRRDHGEGEERDQARGDAPVAKGYSGADLVLGLALGGGGGGGRLGRGGPGARATAAVTALAGRSLTLVRGARGRGTAVGPGARFLLRRSIRSALAGLGRPRAIPLETSLH